MSTRRRRSLRPYRRTRPTVPLSTQITELLKISPTLDSNALYGVSAGYNDLLTNVGYAQAGLITPDAGAGERRPRRPAVRAAGRAPGRGRRQIHRGSQSLRHRQVAVRHREPGGTVQFARATVRPDAQRRAQSGSLPGHPRQYGAAVQRNARESVVLRIHERHDARVHGALRRCSARRRRWWRPMRRRPTCLPTTSTRHPRRRSSCRRS